MTDKIYHKSIYETLNHFIDKKKVPHLLFYGDNGSGKKKIVKDFLVNNYKSFANYKDYVMYVECAHNKGIKYVRDDIKFFAKTNISLHNGVFKTIILNNADKLTTDAQSALRRCIEQFSHSTRFIIIVEDKYRLLKPILSRFCEIYVYLPKVDNYYKNFYEINNNKYTKKNYKYLLENIQLLIKNPNLNIMEISEKIYEKGFSSIDILDMIKTKKIKIENKYELLCILNKERKEYFNEKMFIMILLNIIRIKCIK